MSHNPNTGTKLTRSLAHHFALHTVRPEHQPCGSSRLVFNLGPLFLHKRIQTATRTAHITHYCKTVRVNNGTPARYLDLIRLITTKPSEGRGPELRCRFHSDVILICESLDDLPETSLLYLLPASYW